MTEQDLPEESGWVPENLPDFEFGSGKEILLTVQTSVSLLSNIAYISQLTGVASQEVFGRSVTLGMNINKHRYQDGSGLYREEPGYTQRVDALDEEFSHSLNTDFTLKNSTDLYVPKAAVLTPEMVADLKASAVKADLSQEELLERIVRLGLFVLRDIVQNDTKYFVIESNGQPRLLVIDGSVQENPAKYVLDVTFLHGMPKDDWDLSV